MRGGGQDWGSFLLKVLAVVFVSVAITNVYPRYKTEDVLRALDVPTEPRDHFVEHHERPVFGAKPAHLF